MTEKGEKTAIERTQKVMMELVKQNIEGGIGPHATMNIILDMMGAMLEVEAEEGESAQASLGGRR